jgi:putative acetyltransferase
MLILRSATHADLDAMWALRTRAIAAGSAGHYPAAIMAAWLASPLPRSYPDFVDSGGALIAQQQGAIVGNAILDVRSGEVDAVFVDPQAGGRGIGKAMLAALERMALGHGHARLSVSASLNAVPFYQAAGFVALRQALYAHPSGIGLDCVEMEKHLARAPAGPGA